MSGHSKWSTIKRQKAVTDSRRAAVFTKLGRLIAIAAREGGKDPAMNFKLRLAIDKARAANMPNDNIDRAIKSGAGELRGAVTKEVVYEGFGPGQVAVMVHALSDNPNRTAADMRTLFQKHGGTLGSQNSVGWMFERRGILRVPVGGRSAEEQDALSLLSIDAGAEDVRLDGDSLVIVTPAEQVAAVRDAVPALAEAQPHIELIPTTTAQVADADRERLHAFFEALDDHPDVTDVYSNEA